MGDHAFACGLRTARVVREGPGFDTGGIASELTQRRDASVAVDQDQALAASLGHHDAGDELPTLGDGSGQRKERPWLQQPGVGKAQIQAVQIDFVGGRRDFHARNAIAAGARWR